MARKTQNGSHGKASAVELIKLRNAGRDPALMAIKYATMHGSAFAFVRGTPNLFYQRMTGAGIAPDGPPAWCSGDLHIENFGAYLGDNGLAYFDVNDFDAAMLAPAPWDILRLVTSLLIASPTLKLKRAEVEELARTAIEAWLEALRGGKSLWIERRTAEGLIGELLQGVRRRDPVAFLNHQSRTRDGLRALKLDGKKRLPLDDKDKLALRKWLQAMTNGKVERDFFRLVDAARRIAGVDSLGAPRYVLLIEGTGSPNGNLLLDLKFAEHGAGVPYTPCRQPDWGNDAQRIVEVQKRCQAVPMGFLRAVAYDGKPFVLRQLQPEEDRLDIIEASRQPKAFGGALDWMAQLSAWAQLRASGREGAANADALIGLGATRGLSNRLLRTAKEMEDFVLADWQAFNAAYDKGELGA